MPGSENQADRARVFLVDDHEVVRRGLRELLEDEPDIDVVGEAATASDGLARVPESGATVAIVDLRLPDGDGIELCREIRSRHPHIRFLILTAHVDDSAAFDALVAGADGYVLKQAPGGEVIAAVRSVARGQPLFDAGVAHRVFDRVRDELGRRDVARRLTSKEETILDLIAEGFTNRAIAERLGLAEKTVKNYVSALLAKLGMERRSQAAAFAAQLRRERPDR